MNNHTVWVVVDERGIITGASVNDGRPSAKRFLQPVPKGSRLLLVDGPVRMSAHITNPMVYPPVALPHEFSLVTEYAR